MSTSAVNVEGHLEGWRHFLRIWRILFLCGKFAYHTRIICIYIYIYVSYNYTYTYCVCTRKCKRKCKCQCKCKVLKKRSIVYILILCKGLQRYGSCRSANQARLVYQVVNQCCICAFGGVKTHTHTWIVQTAPLSIVTRTKGQGIHWHTSTRDFS